MGVSETATITIMAEMAVGETVAEAETRREEFLKPDT
jgi:hypothetical protein